MEIVQCRSPQFLHILAVPYGQKVLHSSMKQQQLLNDCFAVRVKSSDVMASQAGLRKVAHERNNTQIHPNTYDSAIPVGHDVSRTRAMDQVQ
jgi:hypothetical protein